MPRATLNPAILKYRVTLPRRNEISRGPSPDNSTVCRKNVEQNSKVSSTYISSTIAKNRSHNVVSNKVWTYDDRPIVWRVVESIHRSKPNDLSFRYWYFSSWGGWLNVNYLCRVVVVWEDKDEVPVTFFFLDWTSILLLSRVFDIMYLKDRWQLDIWAPIQINITNEHCKI